MEQTRINISGMTCGGCVASVQRVLTALPGVEKVEVSLENARATVDYDPAKADVAAMKQAISKAGFGVA